MERRTVYWIGAQITPQEKAEFDARRLQIDDALQSPLEAVRAVVLRLRRTTVAQVRAALEGVARRAWTNGALILLVTMPETEDVARRFAKRAYFRPKVVRDPPVHWAAQEALDHNPGRPEGSAVVAMEPTSGAAEEGQVSLSPRQMILVRRAFDDCHRVTLSPIGGGRTGLTYRAHVTTSSAAGYSRPLPYFVKLASAGKIRRERQAYADLVSDYIPFSCRPNLDLSRCIEIGTSGVLVGNFVEEGEPLGDVAKRSLGIPLLEHLFDVALRGWRLEALAKEAIPVEGKIPVEIFNLKRPVPVGRDARAGELGSTLSAAEIAARLRNANSVKYLRGLIHGDLHRSNIMLRGRDAILLDFASVRRGPIVADPASLEVDLVCSSACERDPCGWQALVDELYDPDTLHRLRPPASHPAPREWLWNAVRQIRTYALESSVNGDVAAYRQALATYFYRRATFRAEGRTEAELIVDEYRRAYSVVVASRLVAA